MKTRVTVRQRFTNLIVATSVAMAGCVAPQSNSDRPAVLVSQFPLPTAGARPQGIAIGPDGNMWFASGKQIGKITASGIITEFSLPQGERGAHKITSGPDGNMWFTTFFSGKIGRITPAGVITLFSVPVAFREALTDGITSGPDGNLWFTVQIGNQIGRISIEGIIATFSLTGMNSVPVGIATGPDGNLWFTQSVGNKIGRITPTGVVTEFSLVTAHSHPTDITVGPDGNLWFIQRRSSKVGMITPSGVITEFSIGTADNSLSGITAGSDGNLWFADSEGHRIGRITPTGAITLFSLPSEVSPYQLASGPDGNLWFTDPMGGKIGKFSMDAIRNGGVEYRSISSAGPAAPSAAPARYADPIEQLRAEVLMGVKVLRDLYIKLGKTPAHMVSFDKSTVEMWREINGEVRDNSGRMPSQQIERLQDARTAIIFTINTTIVGSEERLPKSERVLMTVDKLRAALNATKELR